MNAYVQAQPSGQHWPPAPQRAGFLLEQLDRDSSRSVLVGRSPQRQEHLVLQDFERQMAEFAAEREAAVVELKKFFVFPGNSSVSLFLAEHRSLCPLLLESVPALKQFFGQETVRRVSSSLRHPA